MNTAEHSETIRKIAESERGSAALEYLRESDHNAARQRREGQKLAGLITLVVGLGLMIFLHRVVISPDSDRDSSGLALLIYS